MKISGEIKFIEITSNSFQNLLSDVIKYCTENYRPKLFEIDY